MDTEVAPHRPASLTGAYLACDWSGTTSEDESTLHQLSPYIGKTKSAMAGSLVSQFTKMGDTVYDPFAGSGTVALEAWMAGRSVIANDLSPYASLLTRAKLFPYKSLDDALNDIKRIAAEVIESRMDVDLRKVPLWVRRFFHPQTLRETIIWTDTLTRHRRWFLLASLMGILHHQRPGFLSFPSSHTVPYLRTNKFPRSQFPQLYEYRSLRDRLEAKVRRAFRRMPDLNFTVRRRCLSKSAATLVPAESVDAIITSPPYMRQLDYGRDNRLRLWFLGVDDWQSLDNRISPAQDVFLNLMGRCFATWRAVLKPAHYCVLIIGDACSRANRRNLPQLVTDIATKEVAGYQYVCEYTDAIPSERRVRRGLEGSSSESIIVLRNLPISAQV
ncbi:MAG TPA: DNA methyltransferase [Bryobacteraceae bacterium]|nr:DNA methyltransferase [Bryobacteraceae bacterium]